MARTALRALLPRASVIDIERRQRNDMIAYAMLRERVRYAIILR